MDAKRHFVILLVPLLMAGALRGTAEDSFKPWRCPENGGINVLYCLLRSHGVPCEYSELIRDQVAEIGDGFCTANTLVRVAKKQGLPLQVVSLTIQQLQTCPKPAIVHIDGAAPEEGAFMLVMNVTEHEIFFVNGPSASIETMPREGFRRAWSGIALLPAGSPNRVGFGAIGFAAGLFVHIVFRTIRATVQRSSI